MTAEPTYEYQFAGPDVHGHWTEIRCTLESAKKRLKEARWRNADTEWRIQRRLITPWEDVPDGE